MPEINYERINDYGSITISLASPNVIRSWSYGEVKTPETINYRTYRSEKDGLFCERIFGPERDWECFCGKYKGMKYKDILCDRCGVKITHSKVRRTRMGHIVLAVPVVHIWFFRAMPSRLGTLLGIKSTALQQIIYFQRYVVTDPGDTPLKEREVLSEEDYRDNRAKYGDSFKAMMGAEAVRELLKKLDIPSLKQEEEKLRQDLAVCTQKLKTETLVKRLRLIQALIAGNNDPAWMVMEVVPVIPPELRPLVPLDSGNFATSDLNDLYRRVIYRNNRLAKLLDLNAPSVIIRNEKRMLQQAVDALFDNSRCKRPVQGAGNRPLKSLTDMIKGKQGRFRANLLGKRVDYSARSVIIVGPELRLDQVGLPKKIALELFQPFIIRKLKEKGLADTIKSAKTMLERKDEEIWDVLEEVIEGHPVMLNRAPTLHRMGIQAFYPVLVEGEAIRIHPLVCSGFNADFDGDQMAVHLPLTVESQVEASLLMISTANIFSPAHGNPIITADLDIVLGCYYLTLVRRDLKGEGMVFRDVTDAIEAYEENLVHLGARIYVRMPPDAEVIVETPDDDWVRIEYASNAAGKIEKRVLTVIEEPDRSRRLFLPTSVGRILFHDMMPIGMPFYNKLMNKKALNACVSDCHLRLGRAATVEFLDATKETGFHYATLSGLSFSTYDLRTPPSKANIIREAESKVTDIEDAHQMGDITDGERYNQIVDIWTHVTDAISVDLLKELESHKNRDGSAYLNPVWAMYHSGARGSTTQIRQLAGFRGLMTKPNGRIIETPIRANFREGLRGLEYFSSTHGARKGLADTALKTADSGYLTRKLVEVAQDATISMLDCGTENGVAKGAVVSGEHEEVSLADNIFGRVACDNIVDIMTGKLVVAKGQLIDRTAARRIQELDLGKIRVRSPLTCESTHGICANCYGMDLSTGKLVEPGTAVGVIAAQSIGEPGTQLTMRTFHIGGIAKHAVRESELRADVGGRVKFGNLKVVDSIRKDAHGEDIRVQVVLNRNGIMVICDERGREIGEMMDVPVGAILRVKEGDTVKPRQSLADWDAYNTPILSEKSGFIRFEDIVEGTTMRLETDASGHEHMEIIEHKGDLQPQILILGEDKESILAYYSVPEKAILRVNEGDFVEAGEELARMPREMGTTQDITGGLPRVTELFEARKPKDPAVMAEVDGIVELGERRRGKRQILVKSESGQIFEHLVPQSKHVRVHSGDRVKSGEPLVEGPLVPHDILAISGEEALQNYLLGEIQKVYRAQNVRINDKHIEIIIRQMMNKVKIEDPGDTPLLLTDAVSKTMINKVNKDVQAKGKKPAQFVGILQGVARASLSSESVVAAASFQETTRVLTDAAIAGRRDNLRGLKENVLIGRMIPAGTGFPQLRRSNVRTQPLLRVEVPENVAPEEEIGRNHESDQNG
ncbi:MAG: DNA-directed RNA polymerase subunit beta' [Planctomycetota bacterium]|jgi:DNA-directed RNA polymerase subunit beta'|nr:DNA-directed RNA polymerase subunit beta' [Planctomycetota bacterium]